jgi:hypothetical protein
VHRHFNFAARFQFTARKANNPRQSTASYPANRIGHTGIGPGHTDHRAEFQGVRLFRRSAGCLAPTARLAANTVTTIMSKIVRFIFVSPLA